MLVFLETIVNISNTKLFELLCNMSSKINNNYIYKLLSEKKNKILLYSFDNMYIDIDNCPCSLIYNIEKNKCELNIYIMFIATKYKFRKVGYASIFINEFIEFINKKFSDKYDNINIILDSIMDSVTFYEHIGFKWIINDKYNKNLDILEDETDHFTMIYKLK